MCFIDSTAQKTEHQAKRYSSSDWLPPITDGAMFAAGGRCGRYLRRTGSGRLIEAALEACRLRLRPILMTSISFIAGVLPLALATGAGAEMRQAMGTAVFVGMIDVTLFGLDFTPSKC